ncbi:MAG TPA: CDP-archaeol synthase [Patescibacteria group bacterium]|nr:CDP-archaeol synthase [Patescibacteria group bacterium]
MSEIFFALLFFLPAGVSNVMPVFAAKIPFLKKFDYPVDSYKTIKGVRILGDHKTMRGFVTGIIGGMIALFVVQHFFHVYDSGKNLYLLGFLLSFGALGGDSVKSFFKRQFSIASGVSWVPFDQLDYILGAILATVWYYPLSFYHYMLSLFLWVGIHLVSTNIGYILKLKPSRI